jgi:orotate phosphoribosyltransferase
VVAIVRLADLLDYAGTRPELAEQRDRLSAYRDRYGVAAA